MIIKTPLETLQEIERLATEEVNQPGTIEDRYRTLKRIRAVAQAAVKAADALLAERGRNDG